jgi:hypothetical protein
MSESKKTRKTEAKEVYRSIEEIQKAFLPNAYKLRLLRESPKSDDDAAKLARESLQVVSQKTTSCTE